MDTIVNSTENKIRKMGMMIVTFRITFFFAQNFLDNHHPNYDGNNDQQANNGNCYSSNHRIRIEYSRVLFNGEQ